MELYLLRHAHAIDLADDAARTLSKKGREQVDALAAFLRQSEAFDPTEIWHSPLLRAKETAARLADSLKLGAKPKEVGGLLPEDNPLSMAQRLRSRDASLALVGHEPYLSALASMLVAGAAQPPVFVFKKCALVALEGMDRFWAVRWHISPALLKSD